MKEELELEISDEEMASIPIELLEIELNSPITEEDLRYIQLEEMIFKDHSQIFYEKIKFENKHNSI